MHKYATFVLNLLRVRFYILLVISVVLTIQWKCLSWLKKHCLAEQVQNTTHTKQYNTTQYITIQYIDRMTTSLRPSIVRSIEKRVVVFNPIFNPINCFSVCLIFAAPERGAVKVKTYPGRRKHAPAEKGVLRRISWPLSIERSTCETLIGARCRLVLSLDRCYLQVGAPLDRCWPALTVIRQVAVILKATSSPRMKTGRVQGSIDRNSKTKMVEIMAGNRRSANSGLINGNPELIVGNCQEIVPYYWTNLWLSSVSASRPRRRWHRVK